MVHPRKALAALLIPLAFGFSACTPTQVMELAYNNGVEVTQEEAVAISDYYSASVPDMVVDEFDGTGHEAKALAVASCESGFDPLAKNPKPGSTASGVFQIIRSTWKAYARPGESVWNPRDNIRVAYRIWKDSGRTWRQWECKP